MKNIFDWANNRIAHLKWPHIALVKLSVMAFAFMFAKLLPPLLMLDWWWYFLAGTGFALPVLLKLFSNSRS